MPRARWSDDARLLLSTAAELEADRFCQLIGSWQTAGMPIEEIKRQVAAMSAREAKTLETVLAGLVAGQRALDEALVGLPEFRLLQALRKARPMGHA